MLASLGRADRFKLFFIVSSTCNPTAERLICPKAGPRQGLPLQNAYKNDDIRRCTINILAHFPSHLVQTIQHCLTCRTLAIISSTMLSLSYLASMLTIISAMGVSVLAAPSSSADIKPGSASVSFELVPPGGRSAKIYKRTAGGVSSMHRTPAFRS